MSHQIEDIDKETELTTTNQRERWKFCIKKYNNKMRNSLGLNSRCEMSEEKIREVWR